MRVTCFNLTLSFSGFGLIGLVALDLGCSGADLGAGPGTNRNIGSVGGTTTGGTFSAGGAAAGSSSGGSSLVGGGNGVCRRSVRYIDRWNSDCERPYLDSTLRQLLQ